MKEGYINEKRCAAIPKISWVDYPPNQGWATQLEFLLIQSLKETDGTLVERWQAHPDETPTIHFQRVYQATQFWQGEAPL